MMNSFADSEHARVCREIEVLLYVELNDLLPPEKGQRTFNYVFPGTPSIKDAIEGIGVPHTKIDVILVDDKSVDFGRLLTSGEQVAAYPMFERGLHPQLDMLVERATNPTSAREAG